MLGRDYSDQICSISRSLEVVGERWTLLILRDVLLGRHRFDEFVESLGVTRTVLTQRLRHLVDEGVLERTAYQQRPERFDYHLTDKGRALTPVIAHLLWWGDNYYPEPAGPPRLLQHRDCGGPVEPRFICADCQVQLTAGDIAAQPGPGSSARPLTPTQPLLAAVDHPRLRIR
ncbi:helix-turn-helix domain-containing protein [soil metagenome]